MRIQHSPRKTLGTTLLLAVLVLVVTASVASAKLYTHFVHASQFGHEVNLTEVEKHGGRKKEDVCTAASGDTCQAGQGSGSGHVSSEAGGFNNADSVAVGPESTGNDIYVADEENDRVQVFAPDGEFLFMFGWEVDENTKANICTKASGDKCRAGRSVANDPAGAIDFPSSLTVDPATGEIYVYEREAHRVEKFDHEGHFVWMIGGDVDKTKTLANAPEAERNLCTAVSKDECQVGVESTEGTTSHGAFRVTHGGDRMTVAGTVSERALYVGDQGRIDKFNPQTGAWIGEVPLTALNPSDGYVQAVAVDATGDIYMTASYSYQPGGNGVGVSVLDPKGVLLRTIDPGKEITGLALDPFGRLAVVEGYRALDAELLRGVLFDASSGSEISTFHMTGLSVAFNPDASEAKDELYVASNFEMVEVLDPVPVAVPVTSACKNQTATSITLTGEVNPENVSETRARFLYGTGFAQATAFKSIATSEPVEATIGGLRPNETVPYELTAEDKNYKPGVGEEQLAGEAKACETLFIPPKPEGEPVSPSVSFSSAVLFGEVNPENADTKYGFEYGPCANLEACPGKQRTPPLESSEYSVLSAMQSANELQPATTYRYRLYAENENRTHTQTANAYGNEGSFTTLPAPGPSASTGPVSGVSASSAVLSGSVDSGGAGATWFFQVGVYNPTGTVFTTIVSGATSTEAGAEPEQFLLSGLQPGTTYAYRIVIQSAYTPGGQPLAGGAVLFMTQGLPRILFPPPVLGMLSVPAIVFPKEAAGVTSKSLMRVQRLASAMKACKKKAKRERASCERMAQKKYGVRSKMKRRG